MVEVGPIGVHGILLRGAPLRLSWFETLSLGFSLVFPCPSVFQDQRLSFRILNSTLSLGLVLEDPWVTPTPLGFLSLYLASIEMLTPSNALTNLTHECYPLLLVPSSVIFGISGCGDADINAMQVKHANLLIYGLD